VHVRLTRVEQDIFRDVIGHFATGVAVITARADGRDYGTTASALTSLSMEPPMLLICLKGDSETHAAIRATGRFAVNVLRADQEHVARRFAVKSPTKFEGAEIGRSNNQLPTLVGALAHLECRVAETAVGGTHTVFLADVEDASAFGGEPLTYYRGRFGHVIDG
jgi:4-nitrophenol 2-monooxygenase / 4-nitrocatechol 4-monooxygenase, reductase component